MKLSKKQDLLIIGSVPPPIGGVTVHVKRLLGMFDLVGFLYRFYPITRKGLLMLPFVLTRYKRIHLHVSNSYLRFGIVILSKLTGSRVIFTFHGNVGRFGVFRNFIDRMAIQLADVPIAINEISYEKARKYNARTCLIPAFIPPSGIIPLDNDTVEKIDALKSKYNKVFCTNAYNISMDKDGNEIYQISTLLSVFNGLDNCCLIISDPSGNYQKFIREKTVTITDNILFISFMHDFNAVISMSDCFIRYTTTDGDSLSVKEALTLGKNVIASDVVDRPNGVVLVSLDTNALSEKVTLFEPTPTHVKVDSGFDKLMVVYHDLDSGNSALYGSAII